MYILKFLDFLAISIAPCYFNLISKVLFNKQLGTRALFDFAAVSRFRLTNQIWLFADTSRITGHITQLSLAASASFSFIWIAISCSGSKIRDLSYRRTMGRLTCPCLNVSVHYKGASWDSRPVTARRLFPEGNKDRLSGETVCEVELDVAGVTMVSELSVCETAAARSGYVVCNQTAAYTELDYNHCSGRTSPEPCI